MPELVYPVEHLVFFRAAAVQRLPLFGCHVFAILNASLIISGLTFDMSSADDPLSLAALLLLLELLHHCAKILFRSSGGNALPDSVCVRELDGSSETLSLQTQPMGRPIMRSGSFSGPGQKQRCHAM